MDSINWMGGANFPNSTQTMAMLQGMAQLAGSLGLLGGDNYILKGCDEKAGIVSAGIIILDGMPYAFEGGAKKDKIRIKEEKQTLIAFGKEYPEARTKRSVIFDDSGTHVWGDLKKVLTNKELEKKFENIKGTPLGITEMWVGYLDKIPSNYKICNGDYLGKEEYPELYNVIGTIHGSTSADNFALPDMRQMFVVGHDNRHEDYKAVGKTGGKEKVELKEEEMPKHGHPYSDDTNAQGRFPDIEPGFPRTIGGHSQTNSSGSSSGSGTVYVTGSTGGVKNGPDVVGHENRPPFFTVAYIMKVKE